MLSVTLLGSGGTIPTNVRPLTSLYVHHDYYRILVDCGEGTQMTAKRLGVSLSGVSFILLTHLHADHFLGLPGLLLTYANDGRKEPIFIVGPIGVQKYLQELLGKFNIPFPINFLEITGARESIQLDSLIIECFKVKHNCLCYGYNFIVNRACKFDVEKAEKSGIPKPAWGLLSKDVTIEVNGNDVTGEQLIGANRKGLKVSYATDTGYFQQLAEEVKNADLLFLEGMYTQEPEVAKDRTTYHLTAKQAAMVARDACVRHLCLTHFSPKVKQPELCLPDITEIFKNTVCGYPGCHYDLNASGDIMGNTLDEIEVDAKTFRGISTGMYNFLVTTKKDYFAVNQQIRIVKRNVIDDLVFSISSITARILEVKMPIPNMKILVIIPEVLCEKN